MPLKRRASFIAVLVFGASVLGIAAPALTQVQDAAAAEGETPVQDEVSRSAAYELIEITNANNLASTLIDTLLPVMMDQVRQSNPEISEAFIEAFTVEFRAEVASGSADFTDLQVALDQDDFSEEELRELVDFYRTDVGQKAVEVMPQLMNDALAAGGVWGREIGTRAAERAVARLREQGIDL